MSNTVVLLAAVALFLLGAGMVSAADVTLAMRNPSSQTIHGVTSHPIAAANGGIDADRILVLRDR